MKRRPSLLFPVIFFCLSGVVRVAATTYTVKAGGGGNYTTVQACANVAVAGDTCQIYTGTYNETVSPPSSGTAGNPITFTNSGTALVTSFTINGKSYITINGLSIGNHSSAPTPGIWLISASHINITNNIISYTGGKGIQFNGYGCCPIVPPITPSTSRSQATHFLGLDMARVETTE